MGMMPLVTIGAAIALVPILAIAFLLRRLTRAGTTFTDVAGTFDVSFDLSRAGRTFETRHDSLRLGEARIRQLRMERRKLFRRYLRGLAGDFNRLHQALKLRLVQSDHDRADLAAELTRQRLEFYRSLLLVEFRLALNACGADRLPTAQFVRRAELIHARLRGLAPATDWAVAAVSTSCL